MQKIAIIGSPGAGKSVFAAQLSMLTGIPLFHMDNLYWRADRTHISHEELVALLDSIMEKGSWILDGNYNGTLEQRFSQADTVFFFDFPTKECIKGVMERAGKERSDIPWKEEMPDEEFLSFVENFREAFKPGIEGLLETFTGNVVRFCDRASVMEFIKDLFPIEIKDILANRSAELITENHRSGDLVYSAGDEYILKISEKPDRLVREKQVNDYLKGKVPASETIMFINRGDTAFYLKTCVKGEGLVGDYLKDPVRLAGLLSKAVKTYHSISTEGCTLKNPDSEGDCFVHGDFCLPNILACGDEITGFIDTEASGLGDPWMDYAWCIWSFEYNLGTDRYTPVLLKELGIEFDREKYIKYTDIG